MKKFIFLVLIVTQMVGCASRPKSVSSPKVLKETVDNLISSPSVNSLSTIEVGDSLYSEIIKSDIQMYTVKLSTPASASLDNGYSVQVSQGMSGKLYELKNRYNAFCDYVKAQPSKIDVLAKGVNSCLIDFDNNGDFDKVMFSMYDRYFPLVPAVKYETMKGETFSTLKEEKFKRQAIYQGIHNGAVKIMFREFYDKIIRDAFTQTIHYELNSEGVTTIVFKGFKAEVEKATGTELTYRVISPFQFE